MADGTATLEVADSRFLAFVRPAASSQDAASLQAELKSRFPDAAHVPIGWLCSLDSGSRDVMRWSDDDGEPESASIGHLLTSEIENMMPNTEGLSVAVVRW